MEKTLSDEFKKRLRQLLPQSQELQSEARSELWRLSSLETRSVLARGIPSFFRFPKGDGNNTEMTVMAWHFLGEAALCDRDHWDCLDEVCKLTYELTGITEIYVRGQDTCQRCAYVDGHWIREVL